MPIQYPSRTLLPLAGATALLLSVSLAPPTLAAGNTAARPRPAAVKLLGAKAAEQITEAQLRDYLSFIASDELEGRDTPSRGLDLAAQFIATNLSRWGLKPMGDDGTYFQKIALTRQRTDLKACTLTVADKTLRPGEDFRPYAGTGKATGDLVYVGHGWVVKSKNIDAYKGLDVKGKILVVSGAWLPEGVRFRELDRAQRGMDWFNPALYAEKNGAVGIIRLPNGMDVAEWQRTAGRAGGSGRLSMERIKGEEDGGRPADPAIPTITLSPQQAEALFAGERVTSADALANADKTREPFPFAAGKRAEFNVASVTERLYTRNVVAAIEGTDKKLKDEYVAFGAHYDHVGINEQAGPGDDRIFNGADDDGSGTVALMAMAEAMARSPKERPKRSLLFVWHTGEEQGLWGSEYFTTYPTVPLKQIVAQINIDMIGRSKKAGDTAPRNARLSGTDEVYVIGSRKMSTQLGTLSEQINRNYLNLALNYAYDKPDDPERLFYRSDHYNYAKRGIPIIFYFDGVHEDYHRPGDEVSKIDFAKMEKITRTVLLTALAVADLPKRLVIDKPL